MYIYIYIYREIPGLTMVLAMFRALAAFFLGYTGGGDKAGVRQPEEPLHSIFVASLFLIC